MARITWDAAGSHLYETGVKNGVLYVYGTNGYNAGVAWNGLTAVTESPSGAEATPLYADDIKYLNLYSTEEFGATVEAYTYPESFAQCDGSAAYATGMSIGQQERKSFCLCYRTAIGNDLVGDEYGYKLHVIYGAKASPSERAYATINDSPEAITFSWELNTSPVEVSGYKPTASVTIDSTKLSTAALTALENCFYGYNGTIAAWASGTTYSVGDFVSHDEDNTTKYYCCKTAGSQSTWDATKWIEVKQGPCVLMPDEIKAIIDGLPVSNG